jgi:hypothetical protein
LYFTQFIMLLTLVLYIFFAIRMKKEGTLAIKVSIWFGALIIGSTYYIQQRGRTALMVIGMTSFTGAILLPINIVADELNLAL